MHPNGLLDRFLGPAKGIVAETTILVGSSIRRVNLRCFDDEKVLAASPPVLDVVAVGRGRAVAVARCSGVLWLLASVLHRRESSGWARLTEFAIMYLRA